MKTNKMWSYHFIIYCFFGERLAESINVIADTTFKALLKTISLSETTDIHSLCYFQRLIDTIKYENSVINETEHLQKTNSLPFFIP